MVRKLGLTGTLRWGLRCTGMETIIPGVIGKKMRFLIHFESF